MKPTLPKGTRDFGPIQVLKRNYIIDIIRDVFKLYGFAPIETPAMESLSTLTGKYGEEGDRLLFKVLNNGDFLSDVDEKLLISKNSNAIIPEISKRGLRYDLTVPFARFVVMNQNELTFPFKRYQIQPVWRADRPQKGRYQEFYQCDADIIGSPHLMYEAELIQIYDTAFDRLKVPVTIKFNNRKILFGIAEKAGITDKFVDMTTALDKLDKIAWEGVTKELIEKNISLSQVEIIKRLSETKDIENLKQNMEACPTGLAGCNEIQELHKWLSGYTVKNELVFDITLARGLNYYTGCILEVVANEVKIGSIGGGGRYDDLTGVFGMPGMSGVGISFGLERVYDVMEEMDLFPKSLENTQKVLVVSFDDVCFEAGVKLVLALRKHNLQCEIYPGAAKMQKQMKYANDRQIPYVIVLGSDEIQNNEYSLKDMKTGTQQKLSFEALIATLIHI